MKNTQSIASKLLACGLVLSALAIAGNVSAANAGQGTARVVHIEGAARYSTGNNIWQPLHVGAVLRPGTLIQSAAHSQVDLILGEGEGRLGGGVGRITFRPDPSGRGPAAKADVVRMKENTLLSIDKLLINKTGADVVKETELDLKSGRILGSVRKLSAASKYEVKIPNGVAGIRGTFYDISTTSIKVYYGEIVVAIVKDGNVETKTITTGHQLNLSTGDIEDIPNYATTVGPFVAALLAIGQLPVTPATTFTIDRTIYFVSPTLGATGSSSSGGDGGDDGG